MHIITNNFKCRFVLTQGAAKEGMVDSASITCLPYGRCAMNTLGMACAAQLLQGLRVIVGAASIVQAKDVSLTLRERVHAEKIAMNTNLLCPSATPTANAASLASPPGARVGV